MRYIFAIDGNLRGKHGRHLSNMYSFLCSMYGSVTVYHRSCMKKPLFSAGDTVICATRECLEAFSKYSKNCLSFWDIYKNDKQDWDDIDELRSACGA